MEQDNHILRTNRLTQHLGTCYTVIVNDLIVSEFPVRVNVTPLRF